MRNYPVIFATIIIISSAFIACRTNEAKLANDTVTNETFYSKTTGIIKNVDQLNGKVRVDHQDIPGYMPPMEMEMHLGNTVDANAIKVGDVVDLELERVGSKLTITALKKTGVDSKVRAMNIYAVSCAECHGAKGEGAEKGIPFTSGHALHHTEADFIKTVTNGKNLKKEKHMPAFRDELSDDDIRSVVRYIRNDIQAGKSEEKKPAKHEH